MKMTYTLPRKTSHRLAALSLATVLTLTYLPLAHAEESSQTGSAHELAQVTNGQETQQVQELIPETDVLENPQIDSAPPVNGDGNPGATLGQGIKLLEDTDNLSDDSLEQAKEEIDQAKKGIDVVSDIEQAAPAEAVKATAQTASTRTAASHAEVFSSPNTLSGLSSLKDASTVAQPAILATERTLTVHTGLSRYSSQVQTAATSPTGTGVLGMDVSGWQPSVNWASEYAQGARFAYIKATEGVTYTSPQFSRQYIGSTGVGMKRGGYHFAIPTASSGSAQARYFVANGGGWTADGRTLPGLLDLEYNPYSTLGNTCYNMSSSQLYAWVKDFTGTYKQLTGRYPAIYTTTHWWNHCIGSMQDFNYLPLHLAAYNTVPGAVPAGYSTYDIWQYSATGPFSGDSNVFNGTYAELENFSANSGYKPVSTQRAEAAARAEERRRASQFTLRGGIGSYYYARGGQATFGYPTGNEFPSIYGGYIQNFSNHRSIYWTQAYGSHAVYWRGGIGSRFAANNFEWGWGYPSTDETRFWHGARQFFRNNGKGTVAYWSPSTGVQTFVTDGAIYARWAREGDVKTYGFPVTSEAQGADGVIRVRFENGRTINWTAQRGTWVS